ncbi:hypothetical protein WN48_02570 [Eufriesea mexicana]|uniref:Meiosis-specific nuclear structural protein 1 n=1 Tax=Eufriesea mexicana TaxID=516756 RepID=A0A310SQJ1_9HYME|nr:PREDICTED: vicilin-like seed storage protein At2g18540 [Eufriesea mexicana]XP_017757066.1 PREDICTED: vicilin-like seed storage protein At2g18540 [Eufriesea mexicana]OAD57173.1 hypothetical protein WN48_02570 [Eufriesea mexicana]
MEEGSKEEEWQVDAIKASDFIAKLRRSRRNRESYDEIAELEAELRRAYMAKELRVQLIERETERYIANVRKQHAAQVMREEQQAVLEDDLQQRSMSRKESEDYRKELTSQIKRKEEEKSLMMEEARREREILTEIDRIREHCERFRTQEMKNEVAESMKRERLIFQEMREIREQEDREAEAKKRFEDELYLKEIDERAEKVQRLRDERLQERERTMAEIANILINIETRNRAREEMIADLIIEDIKSELLISEEEEDTARKRMKEQLAADLKEQIVFTEECKLRFVEQDRAFAEGIMRKITEDEKTARLTAEARRRMRVQYREDLARLIETRRKIREEEILSMELAAKEENGREKVKLDRIKEDRKRLLGEHVPNVAGFVDINSLSEEERQIVQQFK